MVLQLFDEIGTGFAMFKTVAADAIIDFVGPEGLRCMPLILRPNTECVIVGAAVGVHTVRATFSGYERPLESGELI